MKDNIHKDHRKRMRDKYEKHGDSVFDTHQLLEMLLFYSQRRTDTNAAAHNLLREHRFGPFEVEKSSELCAAEGIGERSAELISLSADTTVRLLCDMISSSPMESEFSRELFMWLKFRKKSRRCAVALLLDKDHKYVDCTTLAKGRRMRAEDHAAELISLMKERGAVLAVIGHNHINNDPRPSLDDMFLTEYLENKLASEGLCLLEHYVVTASDCIRCRAEK